MVLNAGAEQLELLDWPEPVAGPGQLLLEVLACGVCRTDLHILDGDLAEPAYPLVPGHQIVGKVLELGAGVEGVQPGQEVGVPWLGGSCQACEYCREDRENLCPDATFTGYQLQGGFAERTVADARFCLPIPPGFGALEAAPLLCAGLIGYRALRMAGNARRLGFYGFGASAHILTQVARHQGREVFAFTRDGDTRAQDFARSLGASWAGGTSEPQPVPLDAAILFAPVGDLVPIALRAVRRGGVVICAGIHMSDIPSFPYELLWGERQLRSVANLTRQDGRDFLALAPELPLVIEAHPYPLGETNRALDDLRQGRFDGAAVIVPRDSLD
jgi:propanol-preferring alcohol dehydrogenase